MVWYECYHINLRTNELKAEKQKEDIKLSIDLNNSCSLQAEYLWYIRKCFFNKYTASYGVICVTLIKITF